MTTPRGDRPTAPLGHRTDVVAGRFALEQPIASGGSGTVWTARDLKLDKPCAAKVMRRRDGGDLLRFAREQAVRLRHPHVLTPYSWAAEDEHVVIASELVSGGSLATLSGDWGPLAEPTVVEVVRQLLVALGHVHDVGFVHRDVKPANVLLHATGTGPLDASLADFGLALRPDDARLTEHGTVIGTPGYLAPEVFRPEVPPGPPQDLYALGQLAGSLLTGVQPDGIPREIWLGRIRDPALRHTLAALTDADPDARPADAAAALALLAPAHGDPVPRTAEGEPVDILDQLTHLGDDSPATTPAALLPPRSRATGIAPEPDAVRAAPTPPTPAAPAAPVPLDRTRTPRRRRPWGVGIAAAVLVAAVATAVTAAVTAGGSSGGGTGGPTPGPSTSGTTLVVSAGSTCSWQQQNDDAVTSGGARVTCTATGDGYVWR
ncbi:serine/threonine-protein kinase [Jatrophihabitans sp. YIM 134969]